VEPRRGRPEAQRPPPVGGEARRLAEPVDGGGTHVGRAGQGPAAPRPPSGVSRRREQGPEVMEERVGDPRRAPGTGGLVLEPRQPLGGKPGPPAADAFPVGPQSPGDGGIGEPGRRLENDASPADHSPRDPTPPRPALQGGALGGGQDNREGDLDRVGGHRREPTPLRGSLSPYF
jgi:hypothetical protein